jgi:hypothetical protein
MTVSRVRCGDAGEMVEKEPFGDMDPAGFRTPTFEIVYEFFERAP